MKQLLWVGAGDLAQRCVPHLAADQWHTTALQRQSRPSAFDRCLLADVTDASSLDGLPAETTHMVYSVTPADRSPESYAAVYETGLQNLLQKIHKDHLERFVFISSTAVYGSDPVPQDEHSMLKPSAFNGEYLVRAEQFLQKELGDKLTIIRFSGIYGPGRHRIFDLIRQQSLRINPAMDNYANRIHSEDAARVCAHVLQLPQAADCYVGTDSTPIPLRRLYAHLAEQLQVPAPAFDASLAYESKHFSNQRLLNSGFLFLYPDPLKGYSALLTSL